MSDNAKNSFVIDSLPDDDIDLEELRQLRKVKAAISRKKKELKKKDFDAKHPGIALLRKDLEEKKQVKQEPIKLDVRLRNPPAEPKESKPEPAVAEPKPVEHPPTKVESKAVFEQNGKPVNISQPAPPAIYRPQNGKWF